MSSVKVPEPRRHHYVPRCWLAGFTETGDKDGKLWVIDLRRRRQWQTSPGNAGLIKDFYRLSDEQIDPALAEKALSQIEGEIAPILRRIDQELRAPGVEEFDALQYFIRCVKRRSDQAHIASAFEFLSRQDRQHQARD